MGSHAQLFSDAYAHDLVAMPQQEALTARLLRPQLEHICERLAKLRAEVDAEFAPKVLAAQQQEQHKDYGYISLAHYPFGFCSEIRDGVFARMLGDPFFQELIGKGVVLRSVFIFLRKTFFQNAIQLGNYYIDVANDTVCKDKPKLEWSLIRDLDYENLESWSRFAQIATSYIKVEMYPNLFFPLAFPVTPFIAITNSGRLDLFLAQKQIIKKDLAEDMRRTLALLEDDYWMSRKLPEAYLPLLEKACSSNLLEAFPIEYAPCDVRHLREVVIPEFVQLAQQKPEAAQPVWNSYFELVDAAVKTLRMRRIVPEPWVLERLRAEGKAPAQAYFPDLATLGHDPEAIHISN